jgi:transposase
MKKKFETIQSERKRRALVAWSEGKKVSAIAKELECSRDTIYRWVKGVEKDWSKRQRSSSQKLDSLSRSRIIEAYILLKCPSVAVLRRPFV